jgi:hypothetical protein
VYEGYDERAPWGSAALFFAWLGTMLVLGMGLVSAVLAGFFQFAYEGCAPVDTRYPCTLQGIATLTEVARFGAPAAAVGAVLATWLRSGDRPRVRWLLVGAIAVLLLYLVPAGIARSAYQY